MSFSGGSFIFDEADITLNSEHILLMHDGLFQVGTEEEPFQHKANIVLHGHVRSKELPMYGAKTLAVRHGTLELHGKKQCSKRIFHFKAMISHTLDVSANN